MGAEILKLKPSEVHDFVLDAILCKQVAYIAGPPGIGKSQVIQQVFDECNLKMIDIRLSQFLSEDLTGLPERDEKTGKAKYLPFETFRLMVTLFLMAMTVGGFYSMSYLLHLKRFLLLLTVLSWIALLAVNVYIHIVSSLLLATVLPILLLLGLYPTP